MKPIENLYAKFIQKKLPLNDQLAAARSILANQRTFLSYQRTALTLATAGFAFIRFFDHLGYKIIGWAFIPAAIITFSLGVYRYYLMRDLIRNLEITAEHEKMSHDQAIESKGGDDSKRKSS